MRAVIQYGSDKIYGEDDHILGLTSTTGSSQNFPPLRLAAHVT